MQVFLQGDALPANEEDTGMPDFSSTTPPSAAIRPQIYYRAGMVQSRPYGAVPRSRTLSEKKALEVQAALLFGWGDWWYSMPRRPMLSRNLPIQIVGPILNGDGRRD